MIWFDNPTRAVGQVAFAVAAVLAALAATAAGRRRTVADARLWWTVAVVFALLWIETALNWRFVPRTVAHRLLDARGGYGARAGLQEALLVALGAAIVVAVVASVLVRRRRARLASTTRAAFAATTALVALFAVEAISLHALDVRLYAAVGPLLAVGWLWLAASAVVVGMAAAHSRGR